MQSICNISPYLGSVTYEIYSPISDGTAMSKSLRYCKREILYAASLDYALGCMCRIMWVISLV